MNPIPLDLAGYQHIVTGVIEADDILVVGPNRVKCRPHFSIGTPIPSPDLPDTDVYRTMECPRHEGQTNWEENRKTSSDGRWTGRPMPDGQTFWTPNIEGVETKARTDDTKKPPLAHLPWKALREVSFVQAYGKDKYGDFHNYRKGMEISRNLSCACRHIADFMDGQDNDEETKRSHLASAATRILFALQNHLEGTATDDRYKTK